jgi:ubiquinone/menaquinone biosynthesis C-methylase UbiE
MSGGRGSCPAGRSPRSASKPEAPAVELQGLERWFCSSALWRITTQRAVIPWIVHFARTELPSEADVLEVGSGGGYNAEALLELFPNWRITATDYDAGMVELARRRLSAFGSRVRLERADATALKYEDHSFDLVIAIGVLHHVGAWENALAEMARVLRPGRAVLAVDLLDAFFARPVRQMFPPVRTYRREELVSALPGAGFTRCRIRGRRLWYRMLAQTAPRS